MNNPPVFDTSLRPLTLQANPPEWLQSIRDTLEPFQYTVRDFIITHPRCAVYLNMGGGKTLTTLAALSEIQPDGHILIIAPPKIAKSTWPTEIVKWNIPLRTQSLNMRKSKQKNNPKLVKRSKQERHDIYANLLEQPPTCYFISDTTPLLTDLVDYFATKGFTRKTKDYSLWPFSTVIIDEAQGVKSPSSGRTKTLTKIAGYTDRFIQLSGTPATNELIDIWSQIRMLDGGARLGAAASTFREQAYYPVMFNNNVPVKWGQRPGVDEYVFQAISDIALSATNDSIVIPDIYYHDERVNLDDELMACYKEFAVEAVILIKELPLREVTVVDEHGTTVHSEITAENAAALRAKMLQFASGSIYIPADIDIQESSLEQYACIDIDEQRNRQTLHVHDYKCDRVLELLDDHFATDGTVVTPHTNDAPDDIYLPDGGVIIAYRTLADLAALERTLTENDIYYEVFDGDPSTMQRWNNCEIPVILLQPAAAAHGLNLQHGGHTLIWYTLPDSLEHYMQTNARLHRIGQTNSVHVYHIITRGTIDERILPALHIKQLRQDTLLSALHTDNRNADGTINHIKMHNAIRRTERSAKGQSDHNKDIESQFENLIYQATLDDYHEAQKYHKQHAQT